jgi:hypothetical protein
MEKRLCRPDAGGECNSPIDEWPRTGIVRSCAWRRCPAADVAAHRAHGRCDSRFFARTRSQPAPIRAGIRMRTDPSSHASRGRRSQRQNEQHGGDGSASHRTGQLRIRPAGVMKGCGFARDSFIAGGLPSNWTPVSSGRERPRDYSAAPADGRIHKTAARSGSTPVRLGW